MTTHGGGRADRVKERWSIYEEEQHADPYGVVETDGKRGFIDCEWMKNGDGLRFESCGLADEDEFIASRCWNDRPSGVVIYRHDGPEHAKASWVFSQDPYKGKIGTGILNLEKPRPSGGWGGTWTVKYTYPGAPELVFRLEIDQHTSGLFKLEWHDVKAESGSAGRPVFEGVGLQSGDRLIASWAYSGSAVQLLAFKGSLEQQVLAGECVSANTSSRTSEQMRRLARA